MKWCTVLLSCPERIEERSATLDSLALSDWDRYPAIVVDDGEGSPSLARIMRTWTRALAMAASCQGDAVLILEDDVRIATTIRADVERWAPLVERGPLFLGTLYNVQTPITQTIAGQAIKEFAYGGQAVVMTPALVREILSRWQNSAWAYPDERLFRIGGCLTPIHVHRPSLVWHVGRSTWNPLREIVPYPTGAP